MKCTSKSDITVSPLFFFVTPKDIMLHIIFIYNNIRMPEVWYISYGSVLHEQGESIIIPKLNSILPLRIQ